MGVVAVVWRGVVGGSGSVAGSGEAAPETVTDQAKPASIPTSERLIVAKSGHGP